MTVNNEKYQLIETISRLKEIVNTLKKKYGRDVFNLELNNLEIAILLFELFVFFRKRPIIEPELAYFFKNGRLLFDTDLYGEYESEIRDIYLYMQNYLLEKGYLDSIRLGF